MARQLLDRRNTTALGRWWWTVDRTAFFCMMLLISIGFFLVMAGSPPVARRIGLPEFYFVSRHQIFLLVSIFVLITVSMMNDTRIRKLAILGFAFSLALMLL